MGEPSVNACLLGPWRPVHGAGIIMRSLLIRTLFSLAVALVLGALPAAAPASTGCPSSSTIAMRAAFTSGTRSSASRRSELEAWQEIAARLVTGFDHDRSLIEQFSGFFCLDDLDPRLYQQRGAPPDVVLGAARTREAQVVKQADVLMLHALLPNQYDPRLQRADFAYYAPRCGHGSSLSPSVHALVAARLGLTGEAQGYLRQAAAIDMEESHGNTALGVHIGAMGGLWQAVVGGFAGVTVGPDGLHVDPHLPAEWGKLAFRICYRGRQLHFALSGSPLRMTVSLERGATLNVYVRGARKRVARGEPLVWQPQEIES